MSIPEPPPVPKGIPVTPVLLDWVQKLRTSNKIKRKTTKLIKKRNAFGLKKYGQVLYSQDGRNDIEDARQELGDLLQYIVKAKINRLDISELKDIASLIPQIMNIELQSVLVMSRPRKNGALFESDVLHNGQMKHFLLYPDLQDAFEKSFKDSRWIQIFVSQEPFIDDQGTEFFHAFSKLLY